MEEFEGLLEWRYTNGDLEKYRAFKTNLEAKLEE